jgi:hypothetical protein
MGILATDAARPPPERRPYVYSRLHMMKSRTMPKSRRGVCGFCMAHPFLNQVSMVRLKRLRWNG